MRPYVAGLRVQGPYGAEAFRDGRKRGAVARPEKLIVLHPLRQRFEVHYIPSCLYRLRDLTRFLVQSLVNFHLKIFIMKRYIIPLKTLPR